MRFLFTQYFDAYSLVALNKIDRKKQYRNVKLYFFIVSNIIFYSENTTHFALILRDWLPPHCIGSESHFHFTANLIQNHLIFCEYLIWQRINGWFGKKGRSLTMGRSAHKFLAQGCPSLFQIKRAHNFGNLSLPHTTL